MASQQTTIRVQTLGGTWENLGSDRARGIYYEDLVAEANEWGPSACSFTLRRLVGFQWPDIGAFTPIEIEDNGVLIWSGRVKDTPMRDGVDEAITVEGEGWQYHLDDDLVERTYVQTRTSEYKDMRAMPAATLGANALMAAGQVSNERGTLYLGFPSGTAVVNGSVAGAVLDLGPANTAARMVITWESSNNAANVTLYARGCVGPDNSSWFSGSADAFTVVNTAGASGTGAGTFSTAYRYVQLFALCASGTTFGADVFFKVKTAQVFADAAYESGNASALKASTVVPDVLSRGTTLLSDDRTGILATSTNIPEYAPGEPRTPRQHWDAMNALHDYVRQIDVRKRPIFKPKATVATFEVGEWSAGEFQDASANSGEEINNRAIVSGTSPDGFPIRASRLAASAGVSPSFSNPSFTTNTTGWTATLGSITRDTVTFQSTPAAAKLTSASITASIYGSTVSAVLSGVNAGQTVTLGFWHRSASTTLLSRVSSDSLVTVANPSSAWTYVEIPLRVDATGTVVWRYTNAGGAPQDVWIDTITVVGADTSLPSKRGFRRTKHLPVNVALPTDLTIANGIGDTWLPNHKTTPFKGTYVATGKGAIREALSGAPMEPSRMLLHTEELMRFNDRPDPDTGAWGRNGRIQNVRWTEATNEVEITLDNSRQNFEALLARFELAAGQLGG